MCLLIFIGRFVCHSHNLLLPAFLLFSKHSVLHTQHGTRDQSQGPGLHTALAATLAPRAKLTERGVQPFLFSAFFVIS